MKTLKILNFFHNFILRKYTFKEKLKYTLFFIFYFFHFNISFGENIVVFRYDDFTLEKDSINNLVLSVFEEVNIPIVLGVIPCDSVENFFADSSKFIVNRVIYGLKNKNIEIALHGLTHTKIKNANGEFVNDKSFDEQYRRIRKGKQFLDSIFKTEVISFIPPWNYYDSNTLYALKKANFKVISASLFEFIPLKKINGINYLPQTYEPIRIDKKFFKLLDRNVNILIVIMLHPYSFNKEFTIMDLKSFLFEMKSNNKNQFYTFRDLIDKNKYYDSKMIKLNLERNLIKNFMLSKEILYSKSFLEFIKFANMILNLIISMLVYFSVLFIFLVLKIKIVKPKVFFPFILIFIVGIFTWFHFFGHIKLLFFVTIISVLTGILSVIYSRYSKK